MNTFTNKDLDLVVYGASGYTGRLVAEYLAQRYPGPANPAGYRWAMAGRSIEKLAEVRQAIGANDAIPLIQVDATDPASIQALMAKTRLVLSTVGPYQQYGSELLAACAKAGVDYVDLCGEPLWMHDMIQAHHATAQKSGARIVFSCGFDSVPFDLGVFALQQAFAARYGHAANRVRGRVRAMKGSFSGGTAASFRQTMARIKADPELVRLLTNSFALTPGFTGPPQPRGNEPMIDETLGQVNGQGIWVAPFIMASINTKNIHRSNYLLNHRYGKDFVYDEMLITGPGEKGEALARHLKQNQPMSDDSGPKPGEGPSKEEREAGFYELLFIATDEQGHRLNLTVKGDRDPGYGSTSKMIAESALCLLNDCQATSGGIWTPAPALGAALVERLQAHAGLRFEVESR